MFPFAFLVKLPGLSLMDTNQSSKYFRKTSINDTNLASSTDVEEQGKAFAYANIHLYS